MEKPARSSGRSQERSQWHALFQQNTGDPVQMLVTIFEKELPAPSTAFGQEETIRVSIRDGIGLATRVFLPAGQGPWPVILTRYPSLSDGGVDEGSWSCLDAAWVCFCDAGVSRNECLGRCIGPMGT